MYQSTLLRWSGRFHFQGCWSKNQNYSVDEHDFYDSRSFIFSAYQSCRSNMIVRQINATLMNIEGAKDENDMALRQQDQNLLWTCVADAHLQCVKHHYAKFKYTGIKSV